MLTIMEKTHWKKLINPNYIGVYSLKNGEDLDVTIEKVVREQVVSTGGKKEECTVAYLIGQKPLILNRTNSKTITKLFNSPYIEDWVGKKITLFSSTTKLAGEIVECLRIRDIAPKLPELKANTEEFEKCKKGIKNGYTIAQIKSKYTVSSEIEKLLLS